MALYAKISDLTNPSPYMIMVMFDIFDDATEPDTPVMTGLSHGFQAVIYDANGNRVTETFVQARTRLQTEFNAYAQGLIDSIGAVSNAFTTLRSQAIGYRFPAGT